MSVAVLLAAAPLSAQARQSAQVPLPEIVPAELQVAQLVLSSDTSRAYVVSPAGDLWLYDRRKKTSTRLAKGEVWDLSLAADGASLAYVRAGAKHSDRAVWILPLNPRTGIAAGPERQAVPGTSDAPSISPDGQSVAFARDDSTGVGQAIVIAPIAGGQPRLVHLFPRSVSFVRWTPDGKSLYVGVNPPVACDPGWSCLPLKTDQQQPTGSILRVSTVSGVAVIVASTGSSTWPGVSPDGRLLVFPDTGRNRQMVIVDNTGKRLQTFNPPANSTIQGWLGNSTLLLSSPRTMSRLQRYATGGGAAGAITGSPEPLTDPIISPDGTLTSIAHCASNQCQLRVLGIDGALRREVALAEPYLTGSAWSPDQHWIAFVTRAADQALHFNAVEVATGRIVRLGSLPGANGGRPTLAWNAESRAITVAQDRVVSGSEHHATFHQFDLDARHKELRDVILGSREAGATLADASTAFIYRIGSGAERQLPSVLVSRLRLDGTAAEQPVPLPPAYYYPPGLSADRAWAVWRSVKDETGAGTFELLRSDGTGRRTVSLPFVPAFGLDNPLVLMNGEQLVVRENSSPGHETNVYLATVATGRVSKLFAIPGSQRAQQFALSANGRTIVYTTLEPVAPKFSSLDLADLAGVSRP